MKIIVAGRELEVSDEVISKAIEEKTDVTIENPDLVIRNESEEELFVKNLKEDAKKAGIEIAIKEARTSMGLDFQGKTVENLVEAVKTKTLEDAKIEPEKKVKELMTDIETLKGTIQTITSEKDGIAKQFHSFKSESVINNTLLSSIPDNVTLPKDDMLVILKNKLSFQLDESNRINVLGADGQVMKNPTTLDPLDAKSVVNDFFNQNPIYVKGAGGGGGGSDETGDKSGKMTVEQFIDKKEKEGVSANSPEFHNELNQLIKDGVVVV